MVRALIDGRKTQTRRVLSPQPSRPWGGLFSHNGKWWTGDSLTGEVIECLRVRYAPGDRLWVREAWRAEHRFNDRSPRGIPPGEGVQYLADDPLSPWDARYRHARFMPRWASRLTLTVTDARVQRLWDITEADVLAEGCPLDPHYHDTTQDGSNPHMVRIEAGRWQSPRAWYHTLWNSLHGPDAWDANPFVAAITFTVDQRNIDAGRA